MGKRCRTAKLRERGASKEQGLIRPHPLLNCNPFACACILYQQARHAGTGCKGEKAEIAMGWMSGVIGVTMDTKHRSAEGEF